MFDFFQFLELDNVFFQMGLVQSAQNTIWAWIGFVSLEAFKLKSLNLIFELLNVLVELGFFVFVVFEGISEEFLMVGFLLVAISDVIIELGVVGVNGGFE